MAYGLKYYAEIQNFRRQLTRVEIYQRDYSSDVLQIGDVCGLALEVQGGQDDVYAPIVKTQARLSMISSDDKPTADGIKYGGWGEFFTPDDTLYKVVILTKATPTASSWTARWSGYITPDSWQEGLEYRTAVTITARDNIGHLQDFEFDMAGDTYGLVSIKDLVEAAMDKIHLAMTFAWSAADGALAGPIYLTNAKVVATNFQTEDWYTVLEGLLESIGYTIRFTDYNTVTCAPIRHLHLLGHDEEQDMPNPLDLDFFGGTGEQVPAVKKITDEHDYDFSGEIFLPIMGDDMAFGSEQTYRNKTDKNPDPNGSTVDIPEADGYYNKLTDAGGTMWETGSDMVKVTDYVTPPIYLEDGWDKYAFLAANGTDASVRTQALSFYCGSTDITIKAVFAKKPVAIYEDFQGVKRFGYFNASLYKIRYAVKYEKGNASRYWTGKEWAQSQDTYMLEEEYDSAEGYNTDFEVSLEPCDELGPDGRMYIYFDGIWYRYSAHSGSTANGVFARMASLSLCLNRNNLSRSTVKTINDEKYNILLTRNPKFSPLSTDVPYIVPENYGTALYYYPEQGKPSAFPFMLNWDTVSTDVTKPLPVFIHQQILCYRGANLWQLNGECAPKENGLFWFNCLLEYKNRTYLLQSGTLDFFTGKVDGAVLREFLNYDDIWDDTVPVDPGDPGSWENIPSYPGSGSPSSYSPAGSSVAGGGGGKNYFEEDGEGGVKLKDEYNGLWAAGFMAGGGIGESGGGGGIDLDRVWESLTNNTDKPNVKINAAHIPIASANSVGGIKVGSGLSMAADGTLSATGGATGTVTGVRVGSSGSTLSPDSGGVVTIPYYNLTAQGQLTIGNITVTPLYGVPIAQNTVIGGFKTGFSATGSNKDYALKLNSSYQGYVSVPWTDTTYKLQVNGSWNGDSSGGTSLGTIYAPTTTGTQGYVIAADSNGKPAWTDISGTYLPTAGGTLTGDLRLKPTSTNYGLTLNFGNSSYAYISNDSNRHLSIYAQYGISLSTGSDSYPVTIATAASLSSSLTVTGASTFNGNVTINSAKTLTLGSGVLKWDAINSAWHLEGNFYADGFIAAGGIGSTNTLLVTLEGTQTISGAKTFSADTTFSRIGVGAAPNSTYAIYASGSQYLSGSLTVGGSANITTGLGVGTAWTGGTNKLVVSGSAIATAWNTSSDRRLKENILSIDRNDAIEKLMHLKPVTWTWNKKCGYDGKACAGFVAQDVEPVIPEMVSDGGKYLGLNYTMLHAFEVAGIQGLVEIVDELKRENAEMKKRLGL